jgi:hypothetical protein
VIKVAPFFGSEFQVYRSQILFQTVQLGWVPLSSAVELPLAESQRRRLKDVMEYQKQRQTFLR